MSTDSDVSLWQFCFVMFIVLLFKFLFLLSQAVGLCFCVTSCHFHNVTLPSCQPLCIISYHYLHVMSCHVMSCHVTTFRSCHVTTFMSHHITLCHYCHFDILFSASIFCSHNLCQSNTVSTIVITVSVTTDSSRCQCCDSQCQCDNRQCRGNDNP